MFSQGVTCINVILWFHKCRSSFLPWGSLGNFKHGSAVRGYKFKSACLVNGVQKKKKSREKQACNNLWLFLSLVSKFWEVRMKASESSSHGILGSCSSSWSLFLLTYCKSEDVKCEATGIYFYLNNQWRRWTPCRIIRPKVYLLCAILGGIACNSRIVDEVENFKWTFFFNKHLSILQKKKKYAYLHFYHWCNDLTRDMEWLRKWLISIYLDLYQVFSKTITVWARSGNTHLLM